MWALQLRIIALIALVTVINYIDRSAISFAIRPIEESLGITNTDYGWIAGAFGIGYISMAVLGGRLVDRFGPLSVWAVSAVSWSIVTMAMGFAQGFTSLLILRILLGVAEGSHFPCLLRTITDWLPASWRARSMTMSLLGVPVASVIGAPFLSWLIDAFNWHVMFYLLGLLGMGWAILWVLCFRGRTPNIHKPVHLAGENTLIIEKTTPWKEILSSPPFQMSCFIYFAFGYTVFFALMWLPGYLEQTFSLDVRETGNLAILPWLLSSSFILAGGAFSDKLLRITHDLRSSRSFIIGAGMGLSGIAFLGVAFFNILQINLVLFSFGLACAFAINAPIYSLNADLFHRHAGTAQAIMGLFFALAGILAPGISGWLTDLSGNFQMSIYLIAILSFAAAALAFFLQKPYSPKK